MTQCWYWQGNVHDSKLIVHRLKHVSMHESLNMHYCRPQVLVLAGYLGRLVHSGCKIGSSANRSNACVHSCYLVCSYLIGWNTAGALWNVWRELKMLLSHCSYKDIPSEILAKGIRHLEVTGMNCERLLFFVPTKTQRAAKAAATPCKFPAKKTSKKTTIITKPSDLLRLPFAVNWCHGSKRRPKGGAA